MIVEKIVHFLERNSFINFGLFNITKPLQAFDRKCKVCVIGAGISGIATARQLQYYGFDVTILETSKRIGGRLHSIMADGNFVDLGCSVINETPGNPILMILKQLQIRSRYLKSKRNLYIDGAIVHKKKDKFLENLFLNFFSVLFNLHDMNMYKGLERSDISMETAFQLMLALSEVSLRCEVIRHLRNVVAVKVLLCMRLFNNNNILVINLGKPQCHY